MENHSEIDLVSKGKASFKRGDFKTAQIIFKNILESDPNNTESYYHLGSIFHNSGQIGKAIRAFRKVVELDPGHTNAAISLSILYNDIGKYEEAKLIFESANEKVKKGGHSHQVEDPFINKKFAFKHFELAELYFSYNRYDEALFEYNKSIGLNPDDIEVRIKVAKVYSKKGFVSKAFDQLRTLKNEFPANIKVRVALGILYYANGNIIEAQNEWNRVLEKDPTNKEAQMYIKLSNAATETCL